MKRLFIIIASISALGSCNKKYDTPPNLEYPDIDSVVTIQDLRDLHASQGNTKFETNVSVYGVITMDENDGNIYKSVYMQDYTGGVNVRLLSSGGLYQGDSVRIALKDCYVSKYNGLLQLDSVNADVNVVKQSTMNVFNPEVVTIDQITTAKESELIKIENVQFVQWEVGEKFADKENLQSKDRTLEDQNGNTVIVRNSGYASFADELLPDGSGSIVCIVSHFNGEIQLYIRSYEEVQMTNPRFSGLVAKKDFDDDEVTSGGWTEYAVVGSFAKWETSTAGGAPNPYGVISNYDGVNYEADVWLISPSIDLSGSTTPTLSFDNAYNYGGAALELYVSTDYVSGDPNSATWTNMTTAAIWSGGGFTWVNSGPINLSPFTNSNVHVAFRYQGSNSDGSTWELDNITIKS
jgi:hypothetical protein